jgi:hypothetical protein
VEPPESLAADAEDDDLAEEGEGTILRGRLGLGLVLIFVGLIVVIVIGAIVGSGPERTQEVDGFRLPAPPQRPAPIEPVLPG